LGSLAAKQDIKLISSVGLNVNNEEHQLYNVAVIIHVLYTQ